MGYLIAVFLCVIIGSLFSLFKKNGRRSPPGPWGLPVLGHLPMLGNLPHHNLHQLAKKYGPIMQIRLGLVPTVVVSSPEAAELFLKTHDLIFASRPHIQAGELLSYGQRNLTSAKYGSRWRDLRKLCTLHLLSVSKIESMKSMRKKYVTDLVRDLMDAAEASSVVDICSKVASVVEDMTFGMIIGRGKDSRFDFMSSIDEMLILAGSFNPADYFPFAGALVFQGLGRRMKVVSKVVDGYLESIISEHLQDGSAPKDHDKDFIDVLLSLSKSEEGHHLDWATMKAIILDMIIGSMDTSITATEWALSELLRHPRVMKKVQSELERVVGMERMVEESDLMNLGYLEMVIKESMRLHPVAPLFVPHESMEEVTLNGYLIPKKTRVIVNAFAIGRDPHAWSPNANEFYPERFIDTAIEFRGSDLKFIPFGSGRRGCPGIHLGLTVVRLMIAQLVHCFNWKLPDGMAPEDLDMTEKFGLTVPRASHILVTTTSRLNVSKDYKYV